ncbi:MAG: hypothetical protein HN912_02975 [Candidatus Pacebacteria bacterium]|jgi:hypothetical protein|nr:hypothetical protein [Candidatus Paceibacterota bacterium]MBT7183796.1 hypothetical protein [Candidatus Paceibacterota bacterium]MBT7338866.1 hypothetical protein [Candidatus Jacksonbacteria bacterium]MBT7499488.1 hypothetical protein [Candidatus Paceibacterota bacterium]
MQTAQRFELELQPHSVSSVSTTQTLDQMFPEQKREEKQIKRAKEALGMLAHEISAEELRQTVAEVEYLTEVWLDELERSIFDGLTLRELLHEKGGL